MESLRSQNLQTSGGKLCKVLASVKFQTDCKGHEKGLPLC